MSTDTKPTHQSSDDKPTKNHKAYHHGNLRQALIDAGVQLLSGQDGQDVRDLSLREVARLAGVSAAAPYHHFADKNELITAIAYEGFVKLNAIFDEILQDHADTTHTVTPTEKLSRFLRAYLDFAITHAAHYRLMLKPYLIQKHLHPDFHDAAEKSIFSLITAIRTVRTDLDNPTALTMAVTVWSMGHGFATLRSDGLLEDKAERQILPSYTVLLESVLQHILVFVMHTPVEKLQITL